MSFKVSMLGLACVLVAFLLATTAEAQRSYPLTGNSRGQVGDGLPIPIGFTPAPNGKVQVIPGARVLQTSGPDPKQMTFNTHVLTFDGPDFNLPVVLLNSKVFQVKTDIGIQWPAPGGGPGGFGSGLTFMASGRTGAATVTWCPGQAVTAVGNPGCVDPGTASPGNHSIAGFLRYTRTEAQFGGAIRGNATGTADVALVAAVPGAAPCDHNLASGPGGSPCVVAFAYASPQPTGRIGGPFLVSGATTPGAAPPAPGGLRNARIAANGEILSVTSPGLGAGLANPATNFAGPYTTGRVTVNQSGAVGTPEVFVVTGADNRVNGVGTISLVAGGLSDRLLSGPNGNRAWLNFTVGGDTPGLSSWGVGLVAVMLASAGVWRARRSATAG
jgi:hypothetical protein